MTRESLATILQPIRNAGINAMVNATALHAAVLSGYRGRDTKRRGTSWHK